MAPSCLVTGFSVVRSLRADWVGRFQDWLSVLVSKNGLSLVTARSQMEYSVIETLTEDFNIIFGRNDKLWEGLRGFQASDWWKKGWVGGEADFFLRRLDFFFSEGKAVLLRPEKRNWTQITNDWCFFWAQLVPCTFTRRTWRSLVGWKKGWFLAGVEACYLTMTMIKPVPPFNWLSFRFQTINGIEWRTR